MVDLRARAVRQDNKSFTGADEGRVIDDTVTVLGDKAWAVKALLHAARSNLESYWRAKESGSYNAAVSSLELTAQSVLKLSEIYKAIRVERVDEAQLAAKSEGALPLETMLAFMADLRADMSEIYPEFCPVAPPESNVKRVESRDERECG